MKYINNNEIHLEKARRSLLEFIKLADERFVDVNWHHILICEVVQNFLKSNKKKLAVFIPPQHSKTTIIGENLPAWLFGQDPNLSIVGASYSHNLAKKSNRLIQRKMDTEMYRKIFPKVSLNGKNVVTSSKGSYLRNAEQFEIVNFRGSYKSVGVGGGLTGNPADIVIIDDVVKGSVDASSPTTQSRNWDWAKDVVETRMHNDSKLILIMTRWDVNDLAGIYLKLEPEEWEVLTLPAIKESETLHPLDKRKEGEALWGYKHSAEKILKVKKTKPKTYQSLYQQNPKPSEDLLIFGKYTIEKAFPNNTTKVIGVDFGFSNSKLGVISLEVDNRNKKLYVKELIYKSGITNDELALLLSNTSAPLYCDGAEPKSIQDLRNKGLKAISVTKFPNSVLTMILFVQEYELVIIEGSDNLKWECDRYQWKTDAEGNPINQEIDKDNHLTKALMYALWGSQKQTNNIRTR